MPPQPKINSLHVVFIAVHHLRGVWWPQASVGGFCPAAHWNTSVGSCLSRARAVLREPFLLPKWQQTLFPPLAMVSGPGCLSSHHDAPRPPMSWQLEFDEIIFINIFFKARRNIGAIQLCPERVKRPSWSGFFTRWGNKASSL